MKFAHILPIWWRQIKRGIGGIPLWWRQLAPDHKGNPLWWRQLAPANRKNMSKFHFALTFLLLRVTKNPWKFILIHYRRYPLKWSPTKMIALSSFEKKNEKNDRPKWSHQNDRGLTKNRWKLKWSQNDRETRFFPKRKYDVTGGSLC